MAVPRASPSGASRHGGPTRPPARPLALLALAAPLALLARLLLAPAAPARQGASHPVAFFEVFTGGEAPSDQNQQKGEQAPGQAPMQPQQGPDWKDQAWQRQQDRIAFRKAKADGTRKRTAQEILLQRKKDLVWKAMSTRSSEGVLTGFGSYSASDGSYVRVKLEKPFGLDFIEVDRENPSGAMISQIKEDGSAAKLFGAGGDELDIGDILVKVGDTDVSTMTMNEGLQHVIDAEGEIPLIFFRIK